MQRKRSPAFSLVVAMVAALALLAAGCRVGGPQSRRTGEERQEDLFAAVEQGQAEAVRSLLDKHPEWAGARSDLGNTPLFVAAYNGRTTVARILLNSGANPDAAGTGEMTPLHAGALTGGTDVVRLLLRNGAKTDVRDAMGRTPLHLSAEAGHLEVVRALMLAGADRTVADSQGRTALEIARRGDHRRVVELLSQSASASR